MDDKLQERANIDMGTPCVHMKDFLDLCINEPQKLGAKNLFEDVLIPNYDEITATEINADGTINLETLMSYDIKRYVGFKQFYAKVMVPHAVYSRQILEKKDLTSKLVTTDDEALALVIMENCIEKWNAEYEIRHTNVLKGRKKDDTIKNQKRTSEDNHSKTVTPDKRQRRDELRRGELEHVVKDSGNPGSNSLHDDLDKEGEDSGDDSDDESSEHGDETPPQSGSDTETASTENSEESLECLKGILQKHFLTKEEKRNLPLTKFNEQRQEKLKIIIGWEGPGLERFMEIKESLVNFQRDNNVIVVEIDKQSVANMATELQMANVEKQQQVTQYAKSEKERKKKERIEKIYNNTKLSPFATMSGNKVWEL